LRPGAPVRLRNSFSVKFGVTFSPSPLAVLFPGEGLPFSGVVFGVMVRVFPQPKPSPPGTLRGRPNNTQQLLQLQSPGPRALAPFWWGRSGVTPETDMLLISWLFGKRSIWYLSSSTRPKEPRAIGDETLAAARRRRIGRVQGGPLAVTSCDATKHAPSVASGS